MAISKGYCAINILILPKNFENGGWLVGVLAINVSVAFVMFCALKLVQCGIKVDHYNYGEIVKKALGSKGQQIVNIVLMLVQFSFSIA